MIRTIKKLLADIRFLINRKHLIFYFFTFVLIVFFAVSPNEKNVSPGYYVFLFSLGKALINSLLVSFFAVLTAILISVFFLVSGYGFLRIIMDSVFVFPELIYIVVMFFYLKHIDFTKMFLILSLIRGGKISQILLSEIMSVRNQKFIISLHSIGFSKFEIIKRHILPIISIPVAISFLETIMWFLSMEFVLGFLNLLNIKQYLSVGGMVRYFYENGQYFTLIVSILMFYVFITELSYIVNNIKLKFEIIFKK